MIAHQKRPWFNAVFVAYARWLLRGHFHEIRVEGLESAAAALRASPVLFVANHTAWWDPILLMWLDNYPFRRAAGSDGYALMDAKNLRKLMFFRYLGVFGVDLADPEDRVRIVDYAAGLLEKPGSNVWIFAQGAERPVTERPLGFRKGAAQVAYRAGCVTVPVAVRYEFGRTPKPTCYLIFGEPMRSNDGGALDVAAQESAVVAQLARIEEMVRGAARGERGGEVALTGRRGPIASIMTGALSLITGAKRSKR